MKQVTLLKTGRRTYLYGSEFLKRIVFEILERRRPRAALRYTV